MGLIIYVGTSIWATTLISSYFTIMFGGTTVASILEEDPDYFEPKVWNGNHDSKKSMSSEGNATLSVNGETFEIDMSKIDLNKDYGIPSDFYQTGTVQQRLEMFLLMQEICAREEIKCTPIELCGMWFNEHSAQFGDNGTTQSIYEFRTINHSQDGYNSEGAFQFIPSTWNAYKHSYISKAEDPTLDDSQRVDNPIAGSSRPDRTYTPDEMYTAAVYLTDLAYNKVGTGDSATKRIYDWIESTDLTNEQKVEMHCAMGLRRYNGGGYKLCDGTWATDAQYLIIKKYGTLAFMSGKVTSKKPIWQELLGEPDFKNCSGGILGSLQREATGNPVTDSATAGKSFQECWNTNTGSNIAMTYVYTSYCGGSYVWNGLRALVDAVAKENPNAIRNQSGGGDYKLSEKSKLTKEQIDSALINVQGSEARTVVAFCMSKVGYDYSQTKRYTEGYFDCSSLAFKCWEAAGVNISNKGATTAAEEARGLSEAGKTVSENELQAGDLIFYSYGGNGRFMNITHVGIYVGNGMMVEAANEDQGVIYTKLHTKSAVLYARPSA